MQEFLATRRRAAHSPLRWAISMAALLLLGIAAGEVWRMERHPARDMGNHERDMAVNSPPSSSGNSMNAATPERLSNDEYLADENLERMSEDSDFVTVPYAPPLAQGEFVRVVRTQLRPVALATMGIYVNAAAGEVPAEVMLGEDGSPRAVRLLGDMQF